MLTWPNLRVHTYNYLLLVEVNIHISKQFKKFLDWRMLCLNEFSPIFTFFFAI